MYALRPYQASAVQSIFDYFETESGNPIIVLPTASGKSVIQAAFIAEVLKKWPQERFLLLTHVKELLSQNHAKLDALGIKAGLYSAGLRKREIEQVTVAGIQSIFKRAHEVGDVSIVIIDEAHLVSKTSETMYRTFLDKLKDFCPHVKILGMSATPFRLDSGPLIKGSQRIFTDICYNASIKDLIAQGFLAPLTTKPTTHIDTSSVKKRGGEYIPGDLEKFIDKEGLTKAALDEVEKYCQDRKSWLFFCCGVDHAHHVTEAIRTRGYSADTVVGDTPSKERSERIEAFKAGRLRALVSVGVLTTGFDAPCVDALICLRPTCSPGLWVQVCGRGTRIHPGKTDCLVLDFTSNIETHGPIDQIDIDGDGEVKTSPQKICDFCGGLIPIKEKVCPECGKSPQKYCPKCHSPMALDAVECLDCGWTIDTKPREPKHNLEATTAQILSDGKPTIKAVNAWDFKRHQKEGKPDSMRVRYWCGMEHFDQWICLEHGGPSTTNARLWWLSKGNNSQPPSTTTEALERVGELFMPERIVVKKEGKYWSVKG